MVQICKNKAQCNHCKQNIQSVHTHDYVICKCGKTAVDGGQSYLKRTGMDFTELSTIEIDVESWFSIMRLLEDSYDAFNKIKNTKVGEHDTYSIASRLGKILDNIKNQV